MTRYVDMQNYKIETSITMVVRGGAKINANGGVRIQFMLSSGRQIWIAEASKHMQLSVSQKESKDNFKRGFKRKGSRGKKVKSVNCGEKRFNLEFRWERGQKEKGMESVINSVNDTFSIAIFLRHVGTRETNFNAFSIEKVQ